MQEQVSASSTGTDITTLPPAERAAIALGSSKTEAHLRELVSKSAAILTVVDGAGRDEAHTAGMGLRKARTTITNTGKASREDAQAFCGAVIKEENRLIDIIKAEETRVIGLRDAFDAKLAAQKAERERIEAARVAGIRARINDIRAIPASMASEPSTEIQSEIDAFGAFTADDSFAEFKDEANAAALATVQALKVLLEKTLAAEAEAARIEADRAELAKLRAAAEEHTRQAAAAEAERQRAAKAEQDRLDAQRAELEAEKKAFQDKLDAQAAEDQRRKDELAAAEQQQKAREEQEAALRAEEERAEAAANAIIASTPKVEHQPLTAERTGSSIYEGYGHPGDQHIVDETVIGLPLAEVPPAEQWPDEVLAQQAEPMEFNTIPAVIEQQEVATPPSLRLGQISERLKFTVTADFLLFLGFAPAATDKAAKLYHERDFPAICAALIRHVDAVRAAHGGAA